MLGKIPFIGLYLVMILGADAAPGYSPLSVEPYESSTSPPPATTTSTLYPPPPTEPTPPPTTPYVPPTEPTLPPATPEYPTDSECQTSSYYGIDSSTLSYGASGNSPDYGAGGSLPAEPSPTGGTGGPSGTSPLVATAGAMSVFTNLAILAGAIALVI